MAASLNSEFWRCVNELKIQLQSMHRIERLQKINENSDKENVVRIKELSRDEVISKLENVFLTIVEDLSQEKPPILKYNCRNSWKNTRFNSAVGIEMIDDISKTEHKFDSMASIGKFATTLQIMSFCYRLLQQNTYATKRASMTQERLSSLALMHIHSLTDIGLEEVVDLFPEKYSRRLQLGTLLKDYDDQQQT